MHHLDCQVLGIYIVPLEATPSKFWIEGCGLAWPLQLESCSYTYAQDILRICFTTR